MNLKYIKEEICPVCGCDLIIEESIEKDAFRLKYMEHCNGGRWEHRKFACGQELEYIPNFNKTALSKYSKCTNNKEYELKIEKQKIAKEQIQEFIKNLDVDKEFKEGATRYL